MVDARTIALYNQKVDDYAAFTDDAGPDRHLREFIALIPQGGAVLDLGCGPAQASAHMRDAGLAPDPVDASSGMVALANEKFDIGARLGTFDDIDDTAAFDGVWANFCLLHADRADLPKYLKAIATALKPNGTFHIGMKTGTGAGRDEIDRFYTYVDVKELQDMLTTAGLTVNYTKEGEGPGLAGNVEPFVICRAIQNG
jgi:SAM-dependent methyltransferase